MSLEIRDLDMDKIESVYREIRAEGDRIAQETRTHFRAEQYYISRAEIGRAHV